MSRRHTCQGSSKEPVPGRDETDRGDGHAKCWFCGRRIKLVGSGVFRVHSPYEIDRSAKKTLPP